MSTAIRAADFANSLGVNVHVEYGDSQYADVAAVVSDLAYLGITHVRDGVLDPANEGQQNYDVLAAAGIKFDLIMQGEPIADSLTLLNQFVAAHPGAISAVEGPNEVNNFPIEYKGLSGDAAAIAYQNALFTAVKADTALKGVALYNLTNDVSLGASADFYNVHAYPEGGAQPYATLAQELQNQKSSGQKPVLTEVGYYSLPGDMDGSRGVDLLTQAKLTLNLFLDATKLGIQQTYVYQLLDAYEDPDNSLSENHFGLFDFDNTAKPAATAIHNLTTLLQDSGATASTFVAAPLNYTTAGLGSTGSSLLIEKSSGTYDIVLWNEPQIWDADAGTPVRAFSSPVTVNFGATFQNVSIYDPLTGAAATATSQNASSVDLSISDHPVIVEVSNGTPGSINGVAVSGHALSGTNGADLIWGSSGDDVIQTFSGDDTVNGTKGNDTIVAGSGTDWLYGGQGNDLITAGTGANQLYGNLGNDTLDASAGLGADTIRGGQADDIIKGGAGADWLSGDRGNDTLTGGAGADIFPTFAQAGIDQVTDFSFAQGDRVMVDVGTAYTVSQSGAQVIIDMGAGNEMILAGVQMSSLGAGWIFAA